MIDWHNFTLLEGSLIKVPLLYGTLPVHRVSSRSVATNLISKWGWVRAVWDYQKKRMYAWDAGEATHGDVIFALPCRYSEAWTFAYGRNEVEMSTTPQGWQTVKDERQLWKLLPAGRTSLHAHDYIDDSEHRPLIATIDNI